MLDRFNRFKGHFHNPNTTTPTSRKTYFWGNLIDTYAQVVCRWPLPIRSEPFFLRFTSLIPWDPQNRHQTHCATFSSKSNATTHMLHAHRHLHFHLALWSSTRFGLLIYLIFLWRLLQSGVVRNGRMWGLGLQGSSYFVWFLFFSPLRSTATFATEINKSPPPETSTH